MNVLVLLVVAIVAAILCLAVVAIVVALVVILVRRSRQDVAQRASAASWQPPSVTAGQAPAQPRPQDAPRPPHEPGYPPNTP